MKKTLRLLAAALLAAMLLFAAVGCKGVKAPTTEGDKAVSVVIVNGDDVQTYDVQTDAEYFEGVFVQLVEDGEIDAEYSNGAYGIYITSLNGKAMSATEYWALYSSVADERVSAIVSTSDFDKPYVLGGTSYYSAIVGASSMPCYDGQTYLWVLTDYAA